MFPVPALCPSARAGLHRRMVLYRSAVDLNAQFGFNEHHFLNTAPNGRDDQTSLPYYQQVLEVQIKPVP